VRCQLLAADGKVLAENVYWQSQKDDDVGEHDSAFGLKPASWADMTSLNTMPQVPLQVNAKQLSSAGEVHITVRLRNPCLLYTSRCV